MKSEIKCLWTILFWLDFRISVLTSLLTISNSVTQNVLGKTMVASVDLNMKWYGRVGKLGGSGCEKLLTDHGSEWLHTTPVASAETLQCKL